MTNTIFCYVCFQQHKFLLPQCRRVSERSLFQINFTLVVVLGEMFDMLCITTVICYLFLLSTGYMKIVLLSCAWKWNWSFYKEMSFKNSKSYDSLLEDWAFVKIKYTPDLIYHIHNLNMLSCCLSNPPVSQTWTCLGHFYHISMKV